MLDKRFLETLFNEDEQVCVTDHKAAYRSIPLSDLRNKLVDLTKNDGSDFKLVPVESLKLISINPIKGPRNDESCTAYRNFLIEMDDSALAQQWSYIQELNLPYSLCVFSGGKSLHFAVCLQESLPSEEIYRYYAEWILNVVSQADQNTKNPSRGIRIPGVEREPGQFQKLIDARDRISHDTLLSWLNDYRGFKPKLYEKTQHYPEDATFEPVYHSLWKKTRDQLRDGNARKEILSPITRQ